MAPLDDYKITTEDTAGKSVEELPKRPTDSIRSGGQGMTWKQLQQRFDALSKLIIQKFNAVLDAVAPVSHTHNKAEITDFPLTLPADGGNADTVDNQHAADFAQAVHTHAKAQITDFPAAMPADGGDADTLEGKSLQEIYEEIPTLPGVENAQTLEGKPASSFLLRAGDSMQGDIVFPAGKGICGGETAIPMLYKSGVGGVYVGVTGSQGDDLYLCAGNGKELFALVDGETARIWHQGNDGEGSGLDADTVDGKHAADFAFTGHTHTKAQITDFPTALPASGGNADTVDNKHASDFAVASHTHQKINRNDGQGWGVGPTGYLAPMQDANYIANGSLGSSSYTLATMWSIFWRRNNIGVGLHPDGALAPCDAEGWTATQMDLGTSKWRYGTLYLTDTVQADRLKTADATSASNAIIDANGTIRRTSGSSRRFKRDIADLPDAEADAVLGLRPVRFEFKLDPPGVERNGFIAEEVMEVAPQFVDRTTLEDGTVQCDNVRYGEITSALVSIVKRQQARIEALEVRVAALETTNGGNAIG